MSKLLTLADKDTRALWKGLKLGYTESAGHPLLRKEIAATYESIEPDEVLTFAGAEEAIFCLMNVLVGPGDHVIATWPGYQSLYEVARATGAEITLHGLHEIGRLGNRHRTAPQRGPADHAPHRRQHAAQPDRDDARPDDLRRPQRSPRRAASGCSWTRSTAASNSTRRTASRPAPTPCRRGSRSASCRRRTRWPGCASAGSPRTTATSCIAWRRSRTTRRSARQGRRRSSRSSRCVPATASSSGRAGSSPEPRARGRVLRGLPRPVHLDPPERRVVGFPRLTVPGVSIDDWAADLAKAEGVLLLPGSVFGYSGNHFRLGFGRTDLPRRSRSSRRSRRRPCDDRPVSARPCEGVAARPARSHSRGARLGSSSSTSEGAPMAAGPTDR